MSVADFADLAGVCDDLGEPFVIVRAPAGTYEDGRFVADDDTDEIEASGSITPATPQDLLRLPEARRVERVYRVLTSHELKLEPQADTIEWNGETFEVSSVAPWSPGAFYDALIIRKGDQ